MSGDLTNYKVANLIISLLVHINYLLCISIISICSNHTDEPPPDIMWCRDPFMEILNEIEDLDP